MKRGIVSAAKLAGWGIAALLAGCAGAPAPATQRVDVPVPVSCVKKEDVPVKPVYEFNKVTSTANDGEKVLALSRDWLAGRKYEEKLEAVIAGCW